MSADMIMYIREVKVMRMAIILLLLILLAGFSIFIIALCNAAHQADMEEERMMEGMDEM